MNDLTRILVYFFSFWYVFYVIHIVKKVLYFVSLWQLKEYRIDRMVSFLKTKEARKQLLSTSVVITSILFLFLTAVLVLSPSLSNVPFYRGALKNFDWAVIIIFFVFPPTLFILEGLTDVVSVIRKKWKRPKLTYKSAGIVVTVIFCIFCIAYSVYIYDFLYIYISLLGIDLAIGLFTAIIVLLFNVPSSLIKKRIISKAKKEINSKKNLTVIGITGSVGKTSTKEFLSSLLESKYKVYKTPESINTQIGVASYINSSLKNDADILIVEMGAYKKGEIREITEMVSPKIGVVTYIGTQHLELFGSIKNLSDAKFELIESLPENGLVVLNADSEPCLEMAAKAQKLGKKVLTYSAMNKPKTNITAKNIQVLEESISFDCVINKEMIHLDPKLIGKQNIPNILAAITVAGALNVTSKEIVKGVNSLVSPKYTMEKSGEYRSAVLIDDTFNVSRESMISVLEYIEIYKGKKILIMSPLIELGNKHMEVENEVAIKTKNICDLLIRTNETTPQIAKQKIDEIVSKDSVIVCEGKEAKKYLKYLKEVKK